jgi:undecaprenyl-phosphate 4-deoxy-4-formamido-L-arabinose transferase
MKIMAVIAAWNEKGNTKILAKRFLNTFKNNNINGKAMFILRGTKEESGYNELKAMKNKNIIPVYADDIHGLGPSHNFGFSLVPNDVDYIVTMDSDLNYQPEELPQMLKINADIVVGSRGMNRVGSWWKKGASKLMNVILRKIWKLDVIDMTSNYRLYKTCVIKDIYPNVKATGFEYCPEVLLVAARKGYIIKESPAEFIPRITGKSKMPIFKTMFGYIKLFLRYL